MLTSWNIFWSIYALSIKSDVHMCAKKSCIYCKLKVYIANYCVSNLFVECICICVAVALLVMSFCICICMVFHGMYVLFIILLCLWFPLDVCLLLLYEGIITWSIFKNVGLCLFLLCVASVYLLCSSSSLLVLCILPFEMQCIFCLQNVVLCAGY